MTTKLIPDLRKGCHKGYGFVKFKTQESAERFLERGKVEIDGKTIDVKAANKDSPRYDPNHVNSHNNNNNNMMMMMMNAGGNGFITTTINIREASAAVLRNKAIRTR